MVDKLRSDSTIAGKRIENTIDAQRKLDRVKVDIQDRIQQVKDDLMETAISAINDNKPADEIRDVSESFTEVVPTSRLSVVNSSVETPIDGLSMGGHTLVNVLGDKGDCERVEDFTVAVNGVPDDLSVSQGYAAYGNGYIRLKFPEHQQTSFRGIPVSLKIGESYLIWAKVNCQRQGQQGSEPAAAYLAARKIDGFDYTFSVGIWQSPGLEAAPPSYLTLTAEQEEYTVGLYLHSYGMEYNSNNQGMIDGICVYRISQDEKDYIDSLDVTPARDYIKKKYPFVNGIKNIENIQLTNMGENLLPPFTNKDWLIATGVTTVINDEEISIANPTSTEHGARITVPVIPGQQYTLACDSIVEGGRLRISRYGDTSSIAGGTWIDELNGGHETEVTFTVPSGVNKIFISAIKEANQSVSFRVKRPTLTLGTSKLSSYKRYSPTNMMINTQLCSSVEDRSVRDTISKINNRYYKIKHYNSVTIDGFVDWELQVSGNYTDYKIINMKTNLPLTWDLSKEVYAMKYSGKGLLRNRESSAQGPDNLFFVVRSSTDGREWIRLAVANTDSGWGNDYTPNENEIRAFLNGWRMFTGGSMYNQYNGTGQKRWCHLNFSGSGNSKIVNDVVPDYPVPNDDINYPDYKPYTLQYRLQSPIIEDITDKVTGNLVFRKGLNLLKVESDIVLMEDVEPFYTATYGFINISAYSSGVLRNKAASIIQVYRDGKEDNNWTHFYRSSSNAKNGPGWARIRREDFYETSAYKVTYMEESYDFLDIVLAMNDDTIGLKFNIANNVMTAQSVNVETVSDIKTRVDLLRDRVLTRNKSLSEALTNAGVHTTPIDGSEKFVENLEKVISGKVIRNKFKVVDDINISQSTTHQLPSIQPSTPRLAVEFSPDGNYIAVGHHSAPYFTLLKRDGQRVYQVSSYQLSGACRSVSFSPDGEYIAVGYIEPPYFTLLKKTGDTISLASHAPSNSFTGYVNAVAFSRDGGYIAVGSTEAPYIRIMQRVGDSIYWASTYESLGPCRALSYSKDGTRLAVCHEGGPTFTMLHVNKSSTSFSGEYGIGMARSVDFSPNDQYIAIGYSRSNYFTLLKRDGSSLFLASNYTFPEPVLSVKFSPDGKYIAVGHDSTPYFTLLKMNGDVLTLAGGYEVPGGVSACDFSPDGKYISVTHKNAPFLTLLELDGIEEPVQIEFEVDNVVFGGRKTKVLSDVKDITWTSNFTDTAGDFTSIPTPSIGNVGRDTAFSPDGQYIATVNAVTAPQFKLFKRINDQIVMVSSYALPEHGYTVDFSPDGRYIAVGGSGTPSFTLLKRDGDVVSQVATHDVPGSVNGLKFSPDGNYISLSHALSPGFTLLKHDNGEISVASTQSMPATSYDASFSPNNRFIVVAHLGSGVSLLRKYGDSVTPVTGPFTLDQNANAIDFSPDGKFIIVGTLSSPTLSLLRLTPSGLQIDSTLSIGRQINGLSFSPDGRFIAVAHVNAPYFTLVENNKGVLQRVSSYRLTGDGSGVSFSPDGQYISIINYSAPFFTLLKINSINKKLPPRSIEYLGHRYIDIELIE